MTVGETEQAAPLEAAREPLTVGLVSVIVPHLDDYDNLDACLKLLEAQSFPGDRTEIIIADNGSSRGFDAVRRIVGSRGRVIEVAERRRRARPQCGGAGFSGRGARFHRQRLSTG